MSAWLVRAGEESRHAAAFETVGAIALGWPDIPGLEDLGTLTRADVARVIRAIGRRAPEAAKDAAELIAFRDAIAIGDVVATPDAGVRQVLVGIVTSGYRYVVDSGIGDYRHTRQVCWHGRIERHALARPLRTDTNYRRTLKRLEQTCDEWVELAARMQAGDIPAPPRRTTRGVSRAAEKGLTAMTDRRCPGCGYMWPPSQFSAGSDLCNDCR